MRDHPSHGPVLNGDGTVTFSVWAPSVADLRLFLHDREIAMERPASEQRNAGWWTTTIAAGHGDRYGYVLDGGSVRPDPASRRQPDGVHGLSAVVDPAALGATVVPPGWSAPSVLVGAIYELHIGTFTRAGTFDAALPHLAGLVELGITHVEVMPINAFNGTSGWGYDGAAWYAVHEPYGGPAGFARFVEACHSAGLGVILDVVHNHLGPSGSYLPDFGPYVSEGTGTWGSGLNLDGAQSDPVRALIVGNAVTWCRDYGVDGLRLDAVHALVDSSATHILTELSMSVAATSTELGRPLELIAESDRNDPKTIRPVEEGGHGMTAQWADELHHAIHIALTGEREGYYVDYAGLPDVAAAYTRGFVHDGSSWSAFRERTVGAPLGSDDGRRLVGCIQNHDQIGNRAAGERLVALAPAQRVRVGALLLCAAPHTPMLFMGEEHGETNPFQYFTSHPEPELAEAVRVGRAEEFATFSAFSGEVPDPQDPATVERSTLDRGAATSEAARGWRALWTDLLRLRRQTPALRDGRRDLVDVQHVDEEVLVVVRRGEEGAGVLLAVNLGQAEATLSLRGERAEGAPLLDVGDVRYGGAGEAPRVTDDVLHLPPGAGAIWRLA